MVWDFHGGIVLTDLCHISGYTARRGLPRCCSYTLSAYEHIVKTIHYEHADAQSMDHCEELISKRLNEMIVLSHIPISI